MAEEEIAEFAEPGRAFRPNEYIKATSVEQVVSTLATYGFRAKIVAGGTELNELAKRGLIPHVEKLIDIEDLGLEYVREDSDWLRIGAMTTIADLGRSAKIRSETGLRALSEAVNRIEPTQVKNVATVGGAICSGLPLFDLPTALVAMDARARVIGPRGERIIALTGFFLDYFLTSLKTGEFVVEVMIPKTSSRAGSWFDKLQVTSEDLALVNAAVHLSLDGSGRVRNPKIALGGRGTNRVPTRALRAEQLADGELEGKISVGKVAQKAAREIRPISDQRASAEYRRKMACVLVERCLGRALELAGAD